MPRSSKKSSTPNFENALGELETLVETMEQGELSLEESVKHYERGIALLKQCHQALRQAEQTVMKLSGEGDEEQNRMEDSHRCGSRRRGVSECGDGFESGRWAGRCRLPQERPVGRLPGNL